LAVVNHSSLASSQSLAPDIDTKRTAEVAVTVIPDILKREDAVFPNDLTAVRYDLTMQLHWSVMP